MKSIAIVLGLTIIGTVLLPGIGTVCGFFVGLIIVKSSARPWWKDRKKGWPNHGVRDFFNESERFYNQRKTEKAIEVLRWGIKFSQEAGSGGAVGEMQEMIRSLERET